MRTKRARKSLLGVLGAFLLFAGLNVHAAEGDKKPLTFALIQTEEMSLLGKRWEATLKYIGKQVGTEINFYVTTSYAAVVEGMLGGFVHVAKLGPAIYIVAREKSQGAIVPIVSGARPPTLFSPEPCACYRGRLITKKGAGFDTIASLKGRSLALVDPGSTSGNALARALFPAVVGGRSLDDYFGRIFYSGSHAASAMAVFTGKAAAAFISDSVLERVIAQGKMGKDDLNYLWESPAIPIDAITVNSKTVSPEMTKKLQDAFHGMTKTEEGQALLKETRYWEFSITRDSDYDAMRKILDFEKRTKK